MANYPDAPLLDAWVAAVDGGLRPFTVPGHKRRAEVVWPALGRLLAGDVPLYGGLAPIKDTAGLLAAAEARAASLWGADWCRFSTGGSTEANQVATLALGSPGRPVLVSRNAHRSTLSGLVLAGLRPVWLPTEVDQTLGLPVGLSLPALRAALAAHPDAVGVICVEPSYVGTLSDLPAVVELAHAYGVPVLVDQAWAGHFGFHCTLPAHALQAGADMMIISAHKALASYTQAAMVFARTGLLDAERLDRAADTLATTSPAGSIVAGIDASRALLASSLGIDLLARLVPLVAQARDRLRAAGLVVPGPADFAVGRFDPTKLVVGLPDGGGLAIERDLIDAGMPVEQADRGMLVPIVTLLDDASTVGPLVDTIIASAAAHRASSVPSTSVWSAPVPETVIAPRVAFFAAHETVAARAAIGRVSAELIAPYPPGIPLLAPGERITTEVVSALADARDRGIRIAYAADPTLRSFTVVAD